jgi:N4-(beta-N-acetylglucosaminyl)-L-asparaginase
MRNGMSPTEASQDAIQRIANKYPVFSGAIVAVNRYGQHGILI